MFDGSDDPVALGKQRLRATGPGDAFTHLFQVHTHGKVVFPGAGQDPASDRVIGGYLVDHDLQFVDELQGHPVVGRVFEGNDADPILLGEGEC